MNPGRANAIGGPYHGSYIEVLVCKPEAARLLRVSKGTAYTYIEKGLIPHVRLAGRIIIPRARFEAWLAGEGAEEGAGKTPHRSRSLSREPE